MIQQVTGVNAIVYYAPTMLKNVGTSQNAVFGSILIGVVSVVSCWIGLNIVDRWTPPITVDWISWNGADVAGTGFGVLAGSHRGTVGVRAHVGADGALHGLSTVVGVGCDVAFGVRVGAVSYPRYRYGYCRAGAVVDELRGGYGFPALVGGSRWSVDVLRVLNSVCAGVCLCFPYDSGDEEQIITRD